MACWTHSTKNALAQGHITKVRRRWADVTLTTRDGNEYIGRIDRYKLHSSQRRFWGHDLRGRYFAVSAYGGWRLCTCRWTKAALESVRTKAAELFKNAMDRTIQKG